MNNPYGLTFRHPGQDKLDPAFGSMLAGAGRPLTITSGYRDPAYNARVGGAKQSMHVHGQAADIDMSGMSSEERQELIQKLRASGVRRFGAYSKSPDMLHVDTSDAQGDSHFMFDRSGRNMGDAPEWFKAAATGDAPPTGADPQAPVAAPVAAQAPQAPAAAPSPQAPQAQETEMLPPFNGSPFEQPPQDNSLLDNLTTNPYLMAGLSIMSTGNIGEGALRGLLGAQAALNQQRRYKAERNQAPKVQTFHEGDQAVSKVWNPQTREWEEVGRGPRWREQQQADTGAMKNYQFLIQQGVPPEEARAQAFGGGGTTVNVGAGGAAGPMLGSIPSGHTRTVDPVTGMALDQPNPGTKEAVGRNEHLSALESALGRSQQMIDDIGQHGSEGTPWVSDSEVKGRMAINYGQMLADVAVLRNMGVLQAGELELLQNQLTDPSTFGSNFTSNKLMRSQYQEFQKQIKTKIDAYKRSGALPSGAPGAGAVPGATADDPLGIL